MKLKLNNNLDFRLAAENKPEDGEEVFLVIGDTDWKNDDWYIVTAVYFGGDFYRLEYDLGVGCLRKMPVTGPVKFWAKFDRHAELSPV